MPQLALNGATIRFNPWRGCTKVSPGCAHCYAETLSTRNPKVLGEWGPGSVRAIAAESYWRTPLAWDRQAKAAGERRRVFCASLADVFEEREELMKPRQRLFQLVGQTPHLDWLLLTKRPEVALENWPLWAGYWAGACGDPAAVQRVAQDCVIPNVWLGVSVEDQRRADERIPLLLRTPAAVKFLSVEPLLGAVDLNDMSRTPGAGDEITEEDDAYGPPLGGAGGIDWVIVGGESGKDARPCNVAWVRSLVEQCREAGVSCFVKQLGSRPFEMRQDPTYACEHEEERFLNLRDPKGGDPAEWSEDLRVREFPR